MPMYGYRCSRGHQFDVQQRITEPPVSSCPECGSPVTRVFYPVGIIFKGQGFYKTDSRDSSSAVTPAKDGGPAKEGGPAKDGGPGKDGGSGKDDGSKAAPTAPAPSSEAGGKESSEKAAAPKEDKKSDS